MLLCEVIVQYRICLKHYAKHSAYEGAVQDCEKLFSLARGMPTDRFDIQAYMFRLICD
jgi:hypothetical protein